MKLQRLAKALLESKDPLFNHEEHHDVKRDSVQNKKSNFDNIDGHTPLTSEEIDIAINMFSTLKLKILSEYKRVN